MLYVSHATHEASRLLSELLVNYPMDENGRSAFARAFRLRVEEGGFELLLNDISRYAREANIEGGISIAEVDLNPSVPALVEASIERLLTVIPVGKVLVEGSWELAEFEARVREELAYHWRRRLEGVDMAIAARRAGEGDRDGHCHPKNPPGMKQPGGESRGEPAGHAGPRPDCTPPG